MDICGIVDIVSQDNYDRTFVERVYSSPQLTATEVVSGLRPSRDSAVRVQYYDLVSFKAAAKLLGIMDDVKVWQQSSVLILHAEPVPWLSNNTNGDGQMFGL